MRVKIIGSAAGGGFPQWNCNYHLSRAVRHGEDGFLPRTQSSLAVSANGRDWAIFNASPDIRAQIAATPDLQPAADGALRDSPVRAVVLTNADVDHIAGLLSLRERHRYAVYATERVLEVLEQNSIFNVLDRDAVDRRPLPLSGRTVIADREGAPTGITVDTFSVAGKVALFLEDQTKAEHGFGTQSGDTIGLRIGTTGGSGALYYIPGCAAIDENLKARLTYADCLLFDGTVYTDTEMPDAGVGAKTGKRMGHLAISGPDGSVAQLADTSIARRIYVHINNTNPILDPRSDEAAAVLAAGWEIGFDGMEIAL